MYLFLSLFQPPLEVSKQGHNNCSALRQTESGLYKNSASSRLANRITNLILRHQMALDVQSNSMSQPLRVPLRRRSFYPIQAPGAKLSSEKLPHLLPSREIILPAEIIIQIITYISQQSSQSTLWACTLVSRTWYTSSIARLYKYPRLTPANFEVFVSTICPSKNVRIRHSPLSELVLHLDMSNLVHNSSRSLTARLLGRLKGNIEKFVAPQASFAINSFAALSKCVHLKVLDLSLISTSIEIAQLFTTLATLENLESLFFPRTSYAISNYGRDPQAEPFFVAWPPKLRALHLGGGISDFFVQCYLTCAPQTLERLSIQHCSQIYARALLECLDIIGRRLKYLTIRHPMPRLGRAILDDILLICPSLIALHISADYISRVLFESIPQSHPLQILDLDCSSSPAGYVDLDPDVVFLAVEEGKLPDLRSVRVDTRLGWTASKTVRRDAADLGDILEAAERERPLGVVAGVWVVSD